MKPSVYIFAAAFALVIMGCQGQDPTKRQSDPVADYPNLYKKENTQPYGDGTHKEIPPGPVPDNSQEYCAQPMQVKVEKAMGNTLLVFTEGVQATYNISVRSMLPGKFAVRAKGFDQGPQLKLIKTVGNTATYTLSWTPVILKNDDYTFKAVTLQYANDLGEKCGTGTSVVLNLFINKSKDAAAQDTAQGTTP